MPKLRQIFRRIAQPFLWLSYRWYLSRPRWYKYDGLKIRVLPSVFHPGFLISTKVLLNFALAKNLAGRQVLELGAGSGLIALGAARSGAIVTATDINPMAIASMRESSKKNDLSLQLIESDLFQNIPLQTFDFIFINPPYYPRQARNDREIAFFCGADFEYFRALFEQIPAYLFPATAVYMILSEDCEMDTIRRLAKEKGLEMKLCMETKKVGEVQYVFEVSGI